MIFDALTTDGFFRILIKPGDSSQIIFPEANSYRDQVTAEVVNRTLSLSYDGKIDNEEALDIIVVTPTLSRVQLGGTVQARIENFQASDFTIETSGASRVQSAVEASTVYATLQGTSQLELTGSTSTLEASTSGATQLRAFAVPLQTADLTMEGASRAQVHVSKTLDATLKGATSITYQGNPTVNVPEEQRSKVKKK